LEQQNADFDRYLENGAQVVFLRDWVRMALFFEDLLPRSASEGERRLFLRDLGHVLAPEYQRGPSSNSKPRNAQRQKSMSPAVKKVTKMAAVWPISASNLSLL
jgi:hypothetical protein